MSWIIQSLLNERNTIRSTGDIDSDVFNDLLLVEGAIQKLRDRKLISDADMQIIEFFSNFENGIEKPKFEGHTISKKYNQICNRIAYFLGGYFTNDGYLNYMAEKYKLTGEQLEVLENFINSRYRHKMIRKISKYGYKR